jgi:transposase InsO family protein
VCDRDWSDAHVINEIRSIRKKDSTFGYRLITDELKEAHAVLGENRVHRLCRQNMLYSSIIRPKRSSGKTPGPAVNDDLLKRDFTAKRVNEKWLLDITEHATTWIPRMVATLAYVFSWSRAYMRSAGVSQLSAFRGRSLSSLATY